jgi:magnesium-transporting ATPase (P-type)
MSGGIGHGPHLFTNWAVWAAIGLTIALQLLAVYLPVFQLVLKTVAPTPLEWSVVLLAALAPALIVEGYKGIRNRSLQAAVVTAQSKGEIA